MKKHTLQAAFIKNAGLGRKLDDITDSIVRNRDVQDITTLLAHMTGGAALGAGIGKVTNSIIQGIKKPKKILGVFKPRRYQRLINALDSFKNKKGALAGAIPGALAGLHTGAFDTFRRSFR